MRLDVEETKVAASIRPSNGSLRNNPLFKSSALSLTATFIRSQANLSPAEAQRQSKSQQSRQDFSMPLQFASKRDYVSKLSELLMVEAECERLKTESVAASGIEFAFEERLEIYSKLRLKIPKTHQQHIRQHVIMSVAIDETRGGTYLGTGVVKKVQISRHDPNLTVILQIDCMYPLDRK